MANASWRLIQGGMGVNVSNWRLARAVSQRGHLGVVSGTGIWIVQTRLLQMGDPDGSVRRALAHFPNPAVANRIVERYFVPGGIGPTRPFRDPPALTIDLDPSLAELLVAASFVQVWLAKEGHTGSVGINFLEKIQMCLLPSLYGAVLAGVDAVLIGAGIPDQIPGALDTLARHMPTTYRITVEGATPQPAETTFDPASIGAAGEALSRPTFLAIISSSVLAQRLTRNEGHGIDGFVVEHHTAGGHNAPARDRRALSPSGEPIRSEKDDADLAKVRKAGLRFWLAGKPHSLSEALAHGAEGVQAGSIFALSRDSGMRDDLRRAAIALAREGRLEVFSDPGVSPSGYPFKVAQMPGTIGDTDVREQRLRVCDLGSLRIPYVKPDGEVGYRCPAEPLRAWTAKGGDPETGQAAGCLCNGLFATVGLAQRRPSNPLAEEPPIVTLGADLAFLHDLPDDYGVDEAIDHVLRS